MKKGRSMLRWAGILVTVTIISIYGIGAHGVEKLKNDSDTTRVDILIIESMKAFGKLERPAVVFFHDKHTDALEKKNKDCTTCHLKEKDRLSPKFMRLEDAERQTVMDIFHANCMACHNETKAAKEKSGPVVCGECHKKTITVISARQPMGFDKSLHFRHSKAQEKKCEVCHHEYNKATKKLIYTKGKEGTCRYCHEEVTEENRISMRLASHLGCIDCHRRILEKDKNAGPINCSGCHDPKEQKLIEKVQTVPRMERKQPDIVFIKKGKKGEKEDKDIRMNLVPFNHKAHEEYNDTCRVCHHEDLNACNSCHTLKGTKEGKQVRLEQAMHDLGSDHSCLSCHSIEQEDKNCAGCHRFIEKSRKQESEMCSVCHMEALPKSTAEGIKPDEKMLAAMLLESRKAVTYTFDSEEVPEKVVIKELADKYQPAEFPHRKIVQTLVKNITDNKLANYFHREEGTVCQGCHHNSPATKKPPRCGSCHGKPFDEKNLFKPGLMASYHIQCMECHTNMKLEKPVSTDCTSCHKESKR